MKRILTILLAVGVCFFCARKVSAQVEILNINNDSSAAAVLSQASAAVDYQLPYPGLLPDNFFYKLKTLRDKVIEFLISDPLKKAEFDILQGDKRYNASLYLFRESPQKETIIVSTISKADNYMTEAISQISLAKKQGSNIGDMANRFLLSNEKHFEVLISIEHAASKSLQTQLKQEEGRIIKLKQMILQTEKK